jgi:uncharacterized phage-associated protein
MREGTMHSALKVANYFLDKAKKDKKDVTPLQLMKLVYLAHGWMLGVHGRHLIQEPIEAWQYGPVIPELYQKTKKFKSLPITHLIEETGKDLAFDEDEKTLLDKVYRTYADWTGIKLSALTHVKGSPWFMAWEKRPHDSVISNDIIREYYQDKYNKKH